MEKELNYLGKALEAPEKPFVAILGGAKVSDKIEVIHNLLSKVDALLIGGGMAYTFLKAKGQDVGKSLVEADKLDVAREALKEAEEKGVRFLLPVDHVLADKFARRRPYPDLRGGWSVPCRLDGARYRSGYGGAVYDRDRPGPHHRVEWAHGRL